MINRILRFGLISLFVLFGTASFAPAQIIYKIPDGVFPMDWNKGGFKGMLCLQKGSPSGVFIAFPNEGETSDELRERVAKYVAPMVVGDAKDLAKIPFDVKTIASHKGDVEDRSRYYFFKGEKSSVQILFFERKTTAAVVLYGYFAQKGNDDTQSKIWVGDDLKDPKLLAKFEGSFKVD
jgi:hypothetical protein